MVSDINIEKPKNRVSSELYSSAGGRIKIQDRRRGPRRSLLTSRLTRNIFLSNLIGLLILVAGSLAMNRFQDGLIEAKVENLRSLASTITTVMGEDATGYGSAAQLDVDNARQILRGINVPENWRVRLHDRQGLILADTEIMDETISVSMLDPIVPEIPEPTRQELWQDKLQRWFDKTLHDLPWRQSRRERLRRDLKGDIRKALEGDEMLGQRYTKDDDFIVTVSLPVKRVQQVLGVVTVESNDVEAIISTERKALAPIIGLAFLVTLLSSLALTLFVTRPMRKLARAAEVVTQSSGKRDSIPDLSKRRDEIGDLSSVMRDMTQGLYSRIDDIANFAADVAHEIKNPLTSLRSASDTLRSAATDEQRDKLIDIIQQDVSRMDRLITDISKASKVDANLARETAQTLNIAEVLDNITEFYDQTRSGDGPTVRNVTRIDTDTPVYIRAFETPFAQVLRNLIDNAYTFSDVDGEIRLDMSVKMSEGRERVVITVDDDGPGIPADNLDTIFDRFYTQRPKGSQFGSHSGLGLAICRQIITAHKGRIWAENRQSAANGQVEGARFIIDIPRQTQGGGPHMSKRKRKTKDLKKAA